VHDQVWAARVGFADLEDVDDIRVVAGEPAHGALLAQESLGVVPETTENRCATD
jgi:hypothetical protein